jgi:hypothetical protein
VRNNGETMEDFRKRMATQPTFQVGDLIAAYSKGYHRVTKIEQSEYTVNNGVNPPQKYNHWIVSMTKEYGANGLPARSKLKSRCDSTYCYKVNEEDVKAYGIALAKLQKP